MSVRLLLPSLACTVFLMGQAPPPEDKSISGQMLASGKVKDDNLKRVIPKTGVITDADTLKKVWTALGEEGAVPKIDFEQSFVLVPTSNGPNNLIPTLFLTDDGNLTVRIAQTLIGGPGFGYQFLEVPREGIQTVNGKPLAKGKPIEGQVYIEVTGTLKVGVVAIGGETTGVEITSGNMTFEVEMSEDPRMLVQASELNGKQVEITGQLTRRNGVERGARWIIVAGTLGSAEPPAQPKTGSTPPGGGFPPPAIP